MTAQEFVIVVGVLWTLVGLCASRKPLFDDDEEA